MDVHVYVYVDATGGGERPMRGHGESAEGEEPAGSGVARPPAGAPRSTTKHGRHMIMAMKVVRGRVEDGRVVVAEPLPEGTEVTVVVASGDESFDLDEEQIAALRASIDEADRGELVPLDVVLSGR